MHKFMYHQLSGPQWYDQTKFTPINFRTAQWYKKE